MDILQAQLQARLYIHRVLKWSFWLNKIVLSLASATELLLCAI